MEAKSTEQDYNRVKEDLQLLQNDLAKLTRTVAEGQKKKVNQLREEIRRESEEALDDVRKHGDAAFKRARERGDQAYNRAKSASDRTIADVEHRIGERPFLALLMAFVAGMAIGKLFDLNR